MKSKKYQRIVHGGWKTGMEPPGKRGVEEEDQRTRKHTLAEALSGRKWKKNSGLEACPCMEAGNW
eukprot:1158557-Pelagomonas_calceolata.AAC.9